MKLRTLMLKAFGPFTDVTLDLTGPAHLHLIYGPNEAGKSSALRAMGDLRYGIPMRSSDDFVHPFKSMLVAGVFEDAAGQLIGLARRKGNKDTLQRIDPDTGEPLADATVSPQVLRALTGDVQREQFETMFGLDSAKLRTGGQMLIQGEGELGAALFAASTGTSGIKDMLAALQADARKLYSPRGQSTVLNEAARQIDEARQRHKQALTRPEQWKQLSRAHDEAQRRLAELREQLAAQRRRQAELAVLRTVEPLLRQLEQAQRRWAEVEPHVALAPDARERRLAAEHQRASAQQVLAEAEAALGRAAEQLQALQVEPLLISHAAAIDRLARELDGLRRERDRRAQLQAALQSQAQQLRLQAARLTGGDEAALDAAALQALYGAAPTAADLAALDAELALWKDLSAELLRAQKQSASASERHQALQRDGSQQVAAPLRQALSQALLPAQALGDAQARLDSLQRTAAAAQRELSQALTELKLPSLEALAAARPLAEADLLAQEARRAALQRDMAAAQTQLDQLRTDLAVQQQRRAALAATGEVVTAETLRQARARRDQHWQAIRRVYLDGGASAPDDATAADLPQLFERSQTQADQQADLLREGAERAATIAECEQRIADMTRDRDALAARLDEWTRTLAGVDADWTTLLAQHGLPPGPPAALRQWQAARQGALTLQAQLARSTREVDDLARQMDAAALALHAALLALGRVAPDAALPLHSLVTLGASADRDLALAEREAARRAQDLRQAEADLRASQQEEARISGQLDACRSRVEPLAQRLYLAPGCPAEVVRARSLELRDWVSGYARHAEQQTQWQQMQASEARVRDEAAALAALLGAQDGRLVGEQVGQQEVRQEGEQFTSQPDAQPDTATLVRLEAWMDQLTLRLTASQNAARQRDELQRSSADAADRAARSRALLTGVALTLQALMSAAGVSAEQELPDAESRSEQRRQAQERLTDLNEQLTQASARDAATLRTELGDLDTVAIDAEREACAAAITQLEREERDAITAQQTAQTALDAVDTSDEAAHAREEMEVALARYRAGVRPWAQLKLAELLLAGALKRHSEKAQGPVLALAGDYFSLMTAGRFVRLQVDADASPPQLLAQPANGEPLTVAALSEGTADQLYLALRLAALQVQRQSDRAMPLVLDDVFMTSDDERAACIFSALARFAQQEQVLVFTHHAHLLEIAQRVVGADALRVHRLGGPGAGSG